MLNNADSIDDRLWDVLARRERDLEQVLPAMSGQEGAFYQRLLDMAVLVLESPDHRRPT